MEENDKPFISKFIKKVKLTDDTYSFYFKRGKNSRDFVPGQYFELKIDIKNPDERGNTHVFTCASSPTEKDYYMITTRVIESTFKMALSNLKKGDTVEFTGPWDDLNFDESEILPQVFLAGGIGITPFHSIVKYAVDKKLDLSMTLFVSWGSRGEVLYDEFFREAEQKLKDFRYIPTITHLDNIKDWNGETGRISERLVKKYINKVRNNKFRIAGPAALVKAMRELCVQMNVSKENIVSEEFEGY